MADFQIVSASGTVAVGAANGVVDLVPVVQSEGYLFKVNQLQVVMNTVADTTAQNWYVAWLSIAPSSSLRTTHAPFSAPFFPSDIVWESLFAENERTMQQPIVQGGAVNNAILDNLILGEEALFASQIRFGVTAAGNVAGGAVSFAVRMEVERIKATQAMIDALYRRLSS